jgi:hypothetical protein
MDQSFGWEGMPGEAVLRMPEGEVGAGLVTLHGASNGRARQALFDQIGQCLTPLGMAVLSYERRVVDRGVGLLALYLGLGLLAPTLWGLVLFPAAVLLVLGGA